MVHRIFVGSYTKEISTLSFDPDTHSLSLDSSVTVGHHPSWITRHPRRSSVILAGVEQADGKIVAVLYDDNGKGTIAAEFPSGGADPCTLLAVDNNLLVGNYSSGILATIPLVNDPPFVKGTGITTLAFNGTGPDKERQETSHPHQVFLHPSREEVLVPDLGGDKTWRLTKDANDVWVNQGHVDYKPGSGPRHAAFYNDILYTLLELTSEVSAHRLPPLPSQPAFITAVPTMSKFPGPPSVLGMLAAEILLPVPNKSYPTPYLYVSNRNDTSPEGDVIAIYSVADPEKIELVAEVRSGLKHLRGMLFGGPDEKYLVAGGVQGGGVKVFERIDGGKGLKEIASVDLEAPTGFLWA
ncbi:hypothetical protein EW026_g3072 [Hermanssonia centrifuga]|uniref:Isomerase YbhE n=1 Tax=Hermanssonia centrifuga TaxID=98765 RepID=A0A4S4KQX9_9APHY|nr:hypothetical protein EW026_g3072 [Hermanssonia centrifuga]